MLLSSGDSSSKPVVGVAHVAPAPQGSTECSLVDSHSPGGQLLLVDIVDPGGWGDRQWHIDQAFKAARHFYDQGGEDTDAAAYVVRLLAHPQWLDMTVTDKPPSRGDYRRTAGQVFPDATFNDDLHPLGIQTALMWCASS